MIGGFLATSLIIIIDQEKDFFIVQFALPDLIRIWDIWAYLLFSFLGGFLILLLAHILLRSQKGLRFLCFFTIFIISISVYFLIKNPQIHSVFTILFLAFTVGGIFYFMLSPYVLPILIAGTTLDAMQSWNLNRHSKDIQVEVHSEILPNLSVAHPRFLSKRYESKFIIHIYSDQTYDQVKRRLNELFVGEEFEQVAAEIHLLSGSVVEIELYSPDIEFSPPVLKKLDQLVNNVVFTGKPKDSCHIQKKHTVLLSIRNKETGYELESISFDIQIVDFVFDHISRPLLSNIAAGFSGLGAVMLFMLTLLEQIDTTFGLSSGLAASTIAAAIYARYTYLFRQTVKSP
jgi:hypothetical protein